MLSIFGYTLNKCPSFLIPIWLLVIAPVYLVVLGIVAVVVWVPPYVVQSVIDWFKNSGTAPADPNEKVCPQCGAVLQFTGHNGRVVSSSAHASQCSWGQR